MTHSTLKSGRLIAVLYPHMGIQNGLLFELTTTFLASKNRTVFMYGFDMPAQGAFCLEGFTTSWTNKGGQGNCVLDLYVFFKISFSFKLLTTHTTAEDLWCVRVKSLDVLS